MEKNVEEAAGVSRNTGLGNFFRVADWPAAQVVKRTGREVALKESGCVMRSCPSCFPCMIRQAIGAMELFSGNDGQMEAVCRDVLKYISLADFRMPPPIITQFIHQRIRRTLGCDDPFREIKAEANRVALEVLPLLRQRVSEARNPLEAAMRYAVAGNLLDFSAFRFVAKDKIIQALEDATSGEICGVGVSELERNLEYADKILYLADNAGEIVLDRLLIERISLIAPVTVAVKGMPVANDATREDAEAAGLPGIAQIVDTGTDIPGAVIARCSAEFQQRFFDADVVLAKGQAHYETLNPSPREIFHLFTVKCGTIARRVAHPEGSMVFLRVERNSACKDALRADVARQRVQQFA